MAITQRWAFAVLVGATFAAATALLQADTPAMADPNVTPAPTTSTIANDTEATFSRDVATVMNLFPQSYSGATFDGTSGQIYVRGRVTQDIVAAMSGAESGVTTLVGGRTLNASEVTEVSHAALTTLAPDLGSNTASYYDPEANQIVIQVADDLATPSVTRGTPSDPQPQRVDNLMANRGIDPDLFRLEPTSTISGRTTASGYEGGSFISGETTAPQRSW